MLVNMDLLWNVLKYILKMIVFFNLIPKLIIIFIYDTEDRKIDEYILDYMIFRNFLENEF